MLSNEFYHAVETGDLLDMAEVGEERGEVLAAYLPDEIKIREVIDYFDPGRPANTTSWPGSPPEPMDWSLEGGAKDAALEAVAEIARLCPVLTLTEAARMTAALIELEERWRRQEAERAVIGHIYGAEVACV